MADPFGGRGRRSPDYPATPVDSAAELRAGLSRARMGAAVRRRGNWEQLVKFCVVGGTGYVVNLVVYTLLVRGFDV
ncbi:MAG: hypothetical protein WD380_00675, partial [Gaiellaceae bacterium]